MCEPPISMERIFTCDGVLFFIRIDLYRILGVIGNQIDHLIFPARKYHIFNNI